VRVRVPGDKSLTQRALILAALGSGESRLSGLLHGGDAASTASALRALGVGIPALPTDGGELRIRGRGLRGLSATSGEVDLGNSGTGARLITGVVAGSGLTVTIDGDASLRSRPMRRVSDPLTVMGARFEWLDKEGRLPMTVFGPDRAEAIDWPSPVASAQVKSSILLAGLTGGAFAMVTEPARSRDHTERMFNDVGASIISHAVQGGWRVELRDPPDSIGALDFDIPGDISSAAFVLALGALGCAGPAGVTIEDVGLNPTRTGFLEVLRRMGADLEVTDTTPAHSSEPVGVVEVRPSELVGTTVEPGEVPGMIDELPLVAALGAVADGVTTISGAEELRHKESDRIAVMVENLRALGAEADPAHDGLSVRGRSATLRGRVRVHHDHRIAMAFGVLAAMDEHDITVDNPTVSDVSFPGFRALVHTLASS
jgi:3-phosphoshikimate 1-carboxyvinyltransferase